MPLLPPSHFSFGAGSAPAPLPPPGTHILITDTLAASADFAVYHVVLESLRGTPSGGDGTGVVVVDFSGRKGVGHWESMGKKLGSAVPLKQSDRFSIITPTTHAFNDGSTSPSLYTESDEPSLQGTYHAIAARIPTARLLVLDDLSDLLLLGFPPHSVARFFRSLLALAQKHHTTLLTHLHVDSLASSAAIQALPQPGDLDLLIRLMRVGRGVWWRVEGLRTGRSGVVTGEISSHPLTPLPTDPLSDVTGKVPVIPRARPLQYRMEDAGVRTFAKGTGEGYL